MQQNDVLQDNSCSQPRNIPLFVEREDPLRLQNILSLESILLYLTQAHTLTSHLFNVRF
jgi:hypothetical protein